MAQYDAILMANHGVVTYGADLLTAYMRMETVEHFARISLVTQLLGGPNLLSREEVEKLGEARALLRWNRRAGGPADGDLPGDLGAGAHLRLREPSGRGARPLLGQSRRIGSTD